MAADVTVSYGAAIFLFIQEIVFYMGWESLDAMGRNPLQKSSRRVKFINLGRYTRNSILFFIKV